MSVAERISPAQQLPQPDAAPRGEKKAFLHRALLGAGLALATISGGMKAADTLFSSDPSISTTTQAYEAPENPEQIASTATVDVGLTELAFEPIPPHPMDPHERVRELIHAEDQSGWIGPDKAFPLIVESYFDLYGNLKGSEIGSTVLEQTDSDTAFTVEFFRYNNVDTHAKKVFCESTSPERVLPLSRIEEILRIQKIKECHNEIL
jgi:hypothetical protein